ncbi:unnamed protein product [Brachionus calyciflorus]|uniref:G-protein coupled receptors family 1 profile domain-containing protein n=1 Tax=Brachionus calyciflorus TaxID=104777 RepID=A0A814FK94_9BILA|nr:unnamed protein product [Brachionus calyciflorus]
MTNKIKLSQDSQAKKREASDLYLTIVLVIIIFIFLMTWTPYAMVSMYSAFINDKGVTPLVGTLPAVIAKSSTLWTSLIYVFLNRNIRKRMVTSLKLTFTNSKLSQTKTETGDNSFESVKEQINYENLKPEKSPEKLDCKEFKEGELC